MAEIVNKVAQSGIITIDLEKLIPSGERVLLDLKPWLHMELILREAEFRKHLETHSWKDYEGKFVAVHCSADAIIPAWAYMLIAIELQPYAQMIVQGNLQKLEEEIVSSAIASLNPDEYMDQRVVIKGCSGTKIPASSYMTLTVFLKPLARSIMYGEPCSTVPVYKKKK
ncbi:MAG: DUF2480 family protein [Bacteroidetes bacterium]|nr:MAG: DUF2480 family protein [Bacteroidota bacterium]REK04663.1 MAG: DUF2480 family protein [Bacteroidota bacterium]REK36138.1 MAG: DUF2480 family protein [Bacteroidota bacterium]REK51491.1 MAG: DUF2480 family protein [Bacteroidota bacterium]